MFRRFVVLCMAGAALAMIAPSNLRAAQETNPGQYIVKTSDPLALEELASRAGLELSPLISYPDPSFQTLAEFGDCYVVSGAREQACAEELGEELRALPGIVYVESNARLYLDEGWDAPVNYPAPGSLMSPYTPNDPRYDEQWDKPIAQTDKAWDKSKGDGVTIAFIDTGVDTTHEDLVENLVYGYNFALDNENVSDVVGHGTAVCGVACARMNNSKGVAGTSGRASYMMLRVADNSGNLYPNAIANAINYAADHGAKVISMSFMGSANFTMGNALTNAWNKGVFLCAGVGNDNSTDVGYPAAYDNVMGVGASDPSDTRWSGSNYGTKVDIFAPGGVSTSNGGGYGGVQATSFTTPQIAGLAALIFSAYPNAKPQDVWDNIIQGADTIDSDVGEILRMNSYEAVSKEIVGTSEEPEAEPLVRAPAIAHGAIRFNTDLPSGTPYSLSIFDVSGRRVCEQGAMTGSSGEIRVNTSLARGVYFWQFAAAENIQAGKFVYVQ